MPFIFLTLFIHSRKKCEIAEGNISKILFKKRCRNFLVFRHAQLSCIIIFSLPTTITKRDNIPYLFTEGKNPITYPRTENLTDYNMTLVRSLTKNTGRKTDHHIQQIQLIISLFPILEFLPLSISFALLLTQ